MSDPVTNVEIEDVLSSIRRLVSNGDKARMRDPAPAEDHDDESVFVSETASTDSHKGASDTTDRLVLTPAFLVVDTDHRPKSDARSAENTEAVRSDDEEWREDDQDHVAEDESGDDDDVHQDDHQNHDHEGQDADAENHGSDQTGDDNDHDGDHQVDDAQGDDADEWQSVDAEHELEHTSDTPDAQTDDWPLPLTNMMGGASEEVDTAEGAASPETEVAHDAPDRSELVATIAELEAAISSDAGEYEPDGSEEASSAAIMWPGSAARRGHDVEDAEVSDAQGEIGQDSDATDTAPDHEGEPTSSQVEDAPQADNDVYADDDLDGLLDAGGVQLDEEALRALVAEVVREELTGPLGERITRNVRKLVRREIYRILSSQEFD